MPWNRKPDRCSTASRIVLLGMVPVLMQVPPTTSRRSISATRLPDLAAWMAARWPRPDDDEIETIHRRYSSASGATLSREKTAERGNRRVTFVFRRRAGDGL